MNHARCTGVDDHIQPVAEREECIRRHCRADQRQAGVLCFDGSDTGRIDPAHLTSANAQRHAVGTEYDRVRFDELGDAPGKQHVLHLLRGWLQRADDLDIGNADIFSIRRLHQQAAADALDFEWVQAFSERDFQQAHVLFGGKNLLRFCGEGWRDHQFDELPGNRFGRLAVAYGIKGDDAAKSRSRIGLQRFGISVQRIGTHCHAARIGMFDDHTSCAVEGFHTFPCRIGVADIVVRQFLALQLGVIRQRTVERVQVAIKRSGLMRVFAVAHFLHFFGGDVQRLRIRAARRVRFVGTEAGQVIGDCAIVLGGVCEYFLG